MLTMQIKLKMVSGIRNSKKGEKFQALDNKEYNLEEGSCVITDSAGVLRFRIMMVEQEQVLN